MYLSTSSQRIYHFFFALITALLFVGCVSLGVNPQVHLNPCEPVNSFQTKQKQSERTYPAWFWNTPATEDGLFSVGISQTFAHIETSENHAIQDGLENLTHFLSVRVKGEYSIARRGGGELFSGGNLAEAVDDEVRAFVEKNHQVVAKHISPALTFVLLRLGEPTTRSSVPISPSAPMPKQPRWVTDLPRDSRYIYARGQSNRYYREENSWRAGEQNARIAVALNLEANVRGLTERLNNEMEMISTIRVDAQLSHIQVVSRWRHPEYNTSHVLVRMPISVN